jgi:hypothetical protein
MEFVGDIMTLVFIFAPVVGLYKIFEKMGEAGWKALVPFMNVYVWSKKLNMTWWFMFIPFLNIYLLVMLAFNTAKAFGKSAGYGIGMVFAPFVFYPMLGFSEDKFIGPSKDA